MKQRPTVLQWLASWFRLRNESASGWHKWHRREAQEWLDKATEEITGKPVERQADSRDQERG